MNVAAPEPHTLPPGVNFYNSISDTARAINSSRSKVYLLLAAGELEAVKDGSRLKITGASIVARMAKLPRATIGAGKQASAAA